MKKYIYKLIVLAAALSVCGCRIDDPAPEWGKGESLRGIIDTDVAATKAILVDNPGVKLESFWEAGEQIGVYGGSAENQLFTVTAEDLSYDRKTADFRTDGSIPAGKVTAYSPYQSSAGKDGDAIVVTFPSVQKYVTYNGVVQPDPAANILLGEGSKGAGVNFRNMMAFLKIGQVFEEETVVTSVEFRDLSGAAVTGTMRLSGGNSPKAEITGSGKVLTLDLGEGLEFPSGGVRPLFLVVPAREYAKGFEIAFIDDQGGRTVRTVGTTMGKTLNRSVVYTIGDIDEEDYTAETHAVLSEDAILMTPEALDKVKLLDYMMVYLTDPDGNLCYDVQYHEPIRRPQLSLLVHKDLAPAEGKYMVFNQGTSEIPSGGVYQILECRPSWDYYEVLAVPEVNFAAAYDELQIGGPVSYDDAGNLIEDGGIDLDLASHVVQIIDVTTGESVPYNAAEGGVIQFSEETMTSLLGLPDTKVTTKNFSFPGLSLKHSEMNAECSLGAELKLKTKFAIRSMQKEVQFVHFNVEPEFKLSAEFKLKAGFDLSTNVHLIKLICTPIVIGPIILTPSVDISAGLGISGEVYFSTSVSYVYNAGVYSVSYNKGDGFSARHHSATPQPVELTPELGGGGASLNAYGSLSVSPYLSIYGLFGMGAQAQFKLSFGIQFEDKTKSLKLALQPELEITPSIASLGGYFTHTFKDLTTNVSFDPIWEKYLTPKMITASSGNQSLPLSEKFYLFDVGGTTVHSQVPVSPKNWSYYIKLEEPTAVKYEVKVRVLESNGSVNSREQFSFTPRTEELDNGEYYDDFMACLEAGNPYLYWGEWGATVDDAGTNYREVHTETVGVYPSSDAADFKGDVFEGTFRTEVTSHHKFWTEVVLVPVGGGSEMLLNANHPLHDVYFWPLDALGRSYVEDK